MKDLVRVWDDYYHNTEKNTALKDDYFFSLEIESINANLLKEVKRINKPSIRILELGSGTGFLASTIVSNLSKKTEVVWFYLGVDFSEVAVQRANKHKIKNCEFVKSDFLDFLRADRKQFDFIITQRSIIAIMKQEFQLELLKLIRDHLNNEGAGLFSECTIQGLQRIQKLRKKLKVKPLEKIWHSCYLDENFLSKIFSKVQKIDFSSTYWLITRVIYPHFEEPKHNTKLHEFAASLNQRGDYGLVKLFVVRP